MKLLKTHLFLPRRFKWVYFCGFEFKAWASEIFISGLAIRKNVVSCANIDELFRHSDNWIEDTKARKLKKLFTHQTLLKAVCKVSPDSSRVNECFQILNEQIILWKTIKFCCCARSWFISKLLNENLYSSTNSFKW